MRVLIVFLLFNLIYSTSNFEEVRNQFPVIDSLEETEKYLGFLKNEQDETSQAYFAAMLLMKSKYVKFPLTKLKYFKKGKLLLDDLAFNHQNNIEIRYIRFLLQSEMPNFLGYNNNLVEDYLIIIEDIYSYNLSNKFKLRMLNNMLVSKNISDQKAQKIKQLLNNL
tara:strand:- start:2726 stop:3223 length:498 start_codon:yes stop_codon:yes gene_type:complete